MIWTMVESGRMETKRTRQTRRWGVLVTCGIISRKLYHHVSTKHRRIHACQWPASLIMNSLIEEDLNIFSKATGVVIADGLGVAK